MSSVPEILSSRRSATSERLARLQEHLRSSGTEVLLGSAACIYATGSVGRGEATTHSDLDVFLVARDDVTPLFGRLEFFQVASRLIDAARAGNFPPFSNDGEYLDVHQLPKLIGHLGTREDDHSNVFTARMLLLLESRPVLGEAVYDDAIAAVVGTYWKDFAGNERDFLPVFLTNDIQRYWNTLCLSYEAHGTTTTATRRLLNYKLKFSRLLMCHSAMLYLAWILQARDTVTPIDGVEMARLSPTQRLELIGHHNVYAPQVKNILASYTTFLTTVDDEKRLLLERFADDGYHEKRQREARQFGDAVASLLSQLADQTRLLRYLLV